MAEGSAEWRNVPTAYRETKEYLQNLGLKREDLSGKRILDVGAGGRGFAYDVASQGIQAEVFSLEPRFAIPPEKRVDTLFGSYADLSDTPQVHGKTVAGVAEKIPFLDNSFDLVVSNYAFPTWAPSAKSLWQFYKEAARVTKPGGEIRLYPNYRQGDRQFARSKVDTAKTFIRDLSDSLQLKLIAKLTGLNVSREGKLLILKKPLVTPHPKS